MQSCHSTLKILSLDSSFTISMLAFPPLVKLKKLELLSAYGLVSHRCKDMIDMDYGRNMPQLKEVKMKSSGAPELIPWPYCGRFEEVLVRSSSDNATPGS